MADYPAFADFFAVKRRAPRSFDGLDNPKEYLTNLCRKSRKKAIRQGVPPRPKGGRKVGPEYVAVVRNFARSQWSPERARLHSPSLDRAMRGLAELRNWLENQSRL